MCIPLWVIHLVNILLLTRIRITMRIIISLSKLKSLWPEWNWSRLFCRFDCSFSVCPLGGILLPSPLLSLSPVFLFLMRLINFSRAQAAWNPPWLHVFVFFCADFSFPPLHHRIMSDLCSDLSPGELDVSPQFGLYWCDEPGNLPCCLWRRTTASRFTAPHRTAREARQKKKKRVSDFFALKPLNPDVNMPSLWWPVPHTHPWAASVGGEGPELRSDADLNLLLLLLLGGNLPLQICCCCGGRKSGFNAFSSWMLMGSRVETQRRNLAGN